MSIQRLFMLFAFSTLTLASHADPQADDHFKFSVALQNTFSNAVSQAVIEMAKVARARNTTYVDLGRGRGFRSEMRMGFHGFCDKGTRGLDMFKIRLTPQAVSDLENIKRFLT